jgi:two-component system, NtrC family, nitrogen regulation response regulator GlnG
MNSSISRIWIIDDDSSIRWVLLRALKDQNFELESFESADLAVRKLRTGTFPDVVVTDIRMPGMSGLQLLDKLQQDLPHIPVILMTAHTDLDSAVSAYRGGAFEYLPKPFDIDEAVTLIRRAEAHAKQNDIVQPTNISDEPDFEMIGEAPAMQDVFRVIGRLAKSNMSVLIRGESGTGKELVARALYSTSHRKNAPFVAINTAAIPTELLESELFGHEKGAFTGATQQRIGRFEQADGGSLFLDEIGDMPADLQTRLLRVLSNSGFYRVGGHKELHVNVRIIAATNQDLEKRVQEGRFREDLFHRLNVICIEIPPLRQRREDIERLGKRFLAQAAVELDMEQKHFSIEAMDYLNNFDWPGNVRQLDNVCRRLTVMAPGKTIEVTDLPEELINHQKQSANSKADWQEALGAYVRRRLAIGEKALLEDTLPAFERVMITTALHHTNGHKQAAAQLLGWGRNTLTRKLKDMQLEKELHG